MKKGDIVLIPFPFSNLSGIKNRPALVLIVGSLDITVSFVKTQLDWLEDYDLRVEPSETNGLKKPSIIRLSKIATLDKDLVKGRIGKSL